MRAAIFLLLVACRTTVVAEAPLPYYEDGPPSLHVRSVVISTQAEDIKHGEALFSSDGCAACHNPSAQAKFGPGLLGVTERRSVPWIMKMLHHSEEMERLDPIAKQLSVHHTAVRPDHHVQYDWEEHALIAYLNSIR